MIHSLWASWARRCTSWARRSPAERPPGWRWRSPEGAHGDTEDSWNTLLVLPGEEVHRLVMPAPSPWRQPHHRDASPITVTPAPSPWRQNNPPFLCLECKIVWSLFLCILTFDTCNVMYVLNVRYWYCNVCFKCLLLVCKSYMWTPLKVALS